MPYLSLFSFRGQLGPKVFLVNQLVFKIKTGASVSGVRGLPVWWVSPIRAKVNVRFNECKLHFSDLLRPPLSPFTVMYEQIAAVNRVLGAGMRWMASGPVPAGTLLLGA